MRPFAIVLFCTAGALAARAVLSLGARASEAAASGLERLRAEQAMAREALFVKALYDMAYLKMRSNVMVTSDEVLAEVASSDLMKGALPAEAGSNGASVRVQGPLFSYVLTVPTVDDGFTGGETLSVLISGEGPIEGFSVSMKRSGSSKADIAPDVLAAGKSALESDAARLADACLVPFCQRPRVMTKDELEVLKLKSDLGLIPEFALETFRDIRRRVG